MATLPRQYLPKRRVDPMGGISGCPGLAKVVVVGEARAAGKAKEAIATAFETALLGVHGGEPPPAR